MISIIKDIENYTRIRLLFYSKKYVAASELRAAAVEAFAVFLCVLLYKHYQYIGQSITLSVGHS